MTRLDELVAQIKRDHVYIQTHNFPDPDAIASAFGLQGLLKTRGINATICYRGKIDRYSTEKLIELLGIEIKNLDEEEISTDEDEIILVDAQKGNANIVNMKGNEIICIDHHPIFCEGTYRFADIRTDVGACASIIASYYMEENVPFTRNIATALTFGIHTDTGNLSRGVSKLDVEMLYQMFDWCDQNIIHMLENSNLYFEDLLAYSKAISSMKVYGDVTFANTGSGCPEALVANVSDFMLALVGVTFSVVYSQRKDGIKMSVRSERMALDAGKVVNAALRGIGNGGGHAAMAGGFVPFTGSKEQAEDLMVEIQERFLKIIEEENKKLGQSAE